MANQDFFADIAMTQHPLNHNDKEILPREQTNNVFQESNESFPYDGISVFQSTTYEEKFEKFKKDLNELKGKFNPFLTNHMPPTETVKRITLNEFDFRYIKKHEIFTMLNESREPWEKVTIPDYRGPAGSDAKWKAYYKTDFMSDGIKDGQHAVLRFQCVDYKAFIYVNGNYVGQHEGFFAPFEIDVTNYIAAHNELVIEVHNDVPTKGDEGPVLDGDKIYAATGPGWDDPYVGWHHCPPGAGVFGKVTLEYRPIVFIDDIFVRPNIDNGTAELRIGVMNYEDELPEDLELDVLICPKNFIGDEKVNYKAEIKVIGRGKNEFRYLIMLKDHRLWEPDAPYLYGIICKINKSGKTITTAAKHFGMRKFVSDEGTVPKGKFFLNNKPIILRGANEMGHLQQCVMNGDYEQLTEDILIAKLCNMNYYRITQRPVQEEIYDYMDMLGMMNQSDLPLFSTLRRNQICEAVRQAGEMEHLIRSHPSAVMVTFINEPVCIRPTKDPESKFSKRYKMKGHRHLLRDELEAFFVAARKIIYVENPDRVIKNVEGDYDPPTAEGMPDFHTYTMWYTNHPIPIGKLARGYIPPVKPDWMIGCGEYGAEGLDNEHIMLERYPKDWIKINEKGEWYPTEIIKAQTNAMHGDWYQEQKTMKDWIESSQTHQANATKMMTDALRRRSDYIGHTAIHLLIDAWPSGWMKTLVGCDRVPKKAYYVYADSLVPYRVNLRCDRRYVYEGEKIMVEAWLLNDTSEDKNGKIIASLSMDGKIIQSYVCQAGVDAAYSICAGKIPAAMPQVETETVVHLDAAVIDESGNPVYAERMEFRVYPVRKVCKVSVLGEFAGSMTKALGYEHDTRSSMLVVSEMASNETIIQDWLEQGKNVIALLPDKEQCTFAIGDLKIQSEKGPEIFFAAAKEDLKKYHLELLYNEKADYMDFIACRYLLGDEGEEILYTYGKTGTNGKKAPKIHLSLAKKYSVGKGQLIILSLVLEGKVGKNANLDSFLVDCIEGLI